MARAHETVKSASRYGTPEAADKSIITTVVNGRLHAYSTNHLTCILTLAMSEVDTTVRMGESVRPPRERGRGERGGGGMTSSRHRDGGDGDDGLDSSESSVFTGTTGATGASDTVDA